MAFTRRHLPHWIPEEAAVFVTWRLAGCLPPRAEMLGWDRPSPFVACHASLHHGGSTDDTQRSSVLPPGPVWLQDSRIASVVVKAILHGENVRRFYDLHAWVVMPNHVHAIFEPRTALPTIIDRKSTRLNSSHLV